MADYNDFLRDIEEDPEMRANINMYRDDDVINQLESQMGALTLKESAPAAVEKSPNDAALSKGVVKVGVKERKIVKAKRSTEKAKIEQKRQEAIRKKDNELFKASFNQKKQSNQGEAAEVDDDEDDSDWEDVEEDYPGVKLSELLDGLTLEVNDAIEEDDEEADVVKADDAGSKQVSFAAAAATEEEESKKN